LIIPNSIGVTDPEARSDFARYIEYYWEMAGSEQTVAIGNKARSPIVIQLHVRQAEYRMPVLKENSCFSTIDAA